MIQLRKSSFAAKFTAHSVLLQKLQTAANGIILNGLTECGVKCLPISKRIKESESAWKKYLSKKYSQPFSQMTDLLGFRAVVFLESDIVKVRKAIESCFEIDSENTIDKLSNQKPEIVGYRSLHMICSLGAERGSLTEYRGITDLKFEIQIRTVLQHAWAEIEHEKNYKGSHVLPQELQHRLMLAAGALELVDQEFSRISADTEKYEKEVAKNNKFKNEDKLSKVAIDGILESRFSEFGKKVPSSLRSPSTVDAVEELSDFGIETNKDFSELISSIDMQPLIEEYSGKGNEFSIGLVRDIMMFRDIDRYFERAFKNRWQGTSQSDSEFVRKHTKRDDLMDLFIEHEIEVYPDEYEN